MSLFAYNGSPTSVGMGRAQSFESLTASSSLVNIDREVRYCELCCVEMSRSFMTVEYHEGAMVGCDGKNSGGWFYSHQTRANG